MNRFSGQYRHVPRADSAAVRSNAATHGLAEDFRFARRGHRAAVHVRADFREPRDPARYEAGGSA